MKDKKIEDYVYYDETSSSCLRWKKEPGKNNTIKIGDESFCKKRDDGYLSGHFNYRFYSGHRVVWYLHTGEWSNSSYPINHIDGDKSNNRIGNLERVSRIENTIHKNRGVNKNTTTGVRGVFFRGKRYVVEYRGVYRGIKDTLEEGKELFEKCYQLDKEGIVYRELDKK